MFVNYYRNWSAIDQLPILIMCFNFQPVWKSTLRKVIQVYISSRFSAVSPLGNEMDYTLYYKDHPGRRR